MTVTLEELTALGVSAWLDDLSRDRLDSGNLAELVATRCIRGVTTNPAIFANAISSNAVSYSAQLRDLTAAGADVDEVIRTLTTDDVRRACEVLLPVHAASGGVDGRVSIEVDPRLAHDTQGTIAQAIELWNQVAQPNLLIKIPATLAGLPAITEVIARGISVNVTLIFSVDRYREVVLAYQEGLRRAIAAGIDPTGIESVASFFVSRVDTEIDKRLDAMGPDSPLRGKAGLANARLAWAEHLCLLDSDSWTSLASAGARVQRPLWASTGVKDKAYDDTMYVVDLAVDGCVNTMPEGTLNAVHEHGVYMGDTVTGTAGESMKVVAALAELGISLAQVCDQLETEGVQKFIDSWEDLRGMVSAAMEASRS